jgi:hypothetical protein
MLRLTPDSQPPATQFVGAAAGVPSRTVVFTLGALASIALLTYGLVYIIAMPAVTPGMLVSGSFESVAFGRTAMALQIWAVAVYAFSSLPLNVLFSIRQYRVSPAGIVLGACAICLGLIMQIMNVLPGMAQYLYPGKLVAPPPEMVAYLRQTTWIRFASLDVAAFTLIFIAGLIYAAIFRRSRPLLAYVLVGSVAVFLLHLPFLWIAPRVAVTLMGLSVCIPAVAPLIYAQMAVEVHERKAKPDPPETGRQCATAI